MCEENVPIELIEMDQSICPFCNKLLLKCIQAADSCCNNQQIEPIHGINTCVYCGQVISPEFQREYIDYHENTQKIKKKSIYHRKYHIENVINKLCLDNKIILTVYQRMAIYKVFDEIDCILHMIKDDVRKRLISINYIIKMLLNMIDIPCNKIPISKSKKTLLYYERFWDLIVSLIGDKIKSIMTMKPAYIIPVESI